MSVEIETNQILNDDLASTSLLPSSTANSHNNANNSASTRSRRADSHNEHKVHFNIIEDGETRRSSPFQRAIPLRPKTAAIETPGTGIAARLSMAIRRSLRLGPKQRSTAGQSVSRDEHRPFRSGDDKNVSTNLKDLI
jgi:hypothetical protein